MKHKIISAVAILTLCLPACGGSGKSTNSVWTWVSGSSSRGASGVYATLGSPSPDNVPGARTLSAFWTGSGDEFLLFGGYGLDGIGANGYLNDLWSFNGEEWTWMSGDNTVDSYSVHGMQGVADSTNQPGGRESPATWTDSTGIHYLFGGWGYADSGDEGYLGDMWKLDGSDWTWVAGPMATNISGIYGTLGVTGVDHFPGGRGGTASWTDSSGALWLFGGFGIDANGDLDLLNDLWKYEGSQWTWMGGSETGNAVGSYGTMGSTSGSNIPGARFNSAYWTDAAGDMWLFGGAGYDGQNFVGDLNDLWRFDGTNWTWISGASVAGVGGNWGTLGVPAASNMPSARQKPISWADQAGNFWVFGGIGKDLNGDRREIGDLWRYDGTNWTWMSGTNIVLTPGVYGTKGTASPDNFPGSRYECATWIDSSGRLWLFGGYGNDNTIVRGELNDLWRYTP